MSLRPRRRPATAVLQMTALLTLSWSVMAVTHECGHLLCGWCCGGTLKAADLRPWHLPFSIFDPDPHPLMTAWGGPILGVLIPVLMAAAIRHRIATLIAGFCVLANGLYLATAWLTGDRYLDTAQLLLHGASPVSIAVFCVITITTGYLGFRRSCIELLTERPGDLSDAD
ncbi:MAG: hypothetical protein R3C49_07220 [Planctomycetaceae bacterium]